jgi:YVTN family beta-propeller protein
MDRPLFQAVVFDRRGLDLRESPSRIGDVATVTLRWPAWMLVLTAALPACSFLGSESARITERAGASRGGAVRGPGAVTEIAIGYPATSGQPPRLFRFELQVQGAPAPPDAAPRRLGGKSGVLAFAAGADRARFFWDERGVRYAASLLDLGPRTVPALDALVRALRPVSELRLGGRDDARRRVTTFPVPVRGPVSLAAAGPYLFVAGQGSAAVPPASSQAPAVVRMSASRMRALGEPATVDASPGTVAIMQGESVIWVTHRAPGAVPLQLMDPGTGRFFGPAHGALQPVAVAVGFDAVWIVDLQGGYVRRADTVAGRIFASVPVGRAPAGIATGEERVWVTNALDDTVTRIDPATNRAVATIRVGDRPTGIDATEGAIRVANGGDGTVSRIDPRSNRVAATIRVGRGPRAVTHDRRSVWVTNELSDSVTRDRPRERPRRREDPRRRGTSRDRVRAQGRLGREQPRPHGHPHRAMSQAPPSRHATVSVETAAGELRRTGELVCHER